MGRADYNWVRVHVNEWIRVKIIRKVVLKIRMQEHLIKNSNVNVSRISHVVRLGITPYILTFHLSNNSFMMIHSARLHLNRKKTQQLSDSSWFPVTFQRIEMNICIVSDWLRQRGDLFLPRTATIKIFMSEPTTHQNICDTVRRSFTWEFRKITEQMKMLAVSIFKKVVLRVLESDSQ